MTKQEMYETVFRYYNLPGTEFGWDSQGSSCAYLTPGGQRCAVGVLIPEKEALDDLIMHCSGGVNELREELRHAAEYMEGDPAERRAARRVLRILGLEIGSETAADNLSFLQEVQRIHDQEAEEFSYSKDIRCWECADCNTGWSKCENERDIEPPCLIDAKRRMLEKLNVFAANEGLTTLEVTL